MKFTFGKYPKQPSKRDVIKQVLEGIVRQQSYLDRGLDSDLNPTDRGHWYRVVKDSSGTVTYYCWLYVSGVALALNNEGPNEKVQAIIAHSRGDAKQVYEDLFEQVEAGKHNDLIKKHLADHPRKPRTGGAS